jgi:type IV pilus assembly protein PilA
MKTEFKAKFLQHLQQRKQDEGFTLIELLVVIIIIGILAAIALPSFLNQAAKARQSEAKTYVGSVNRSQQAYYVENSAFASDFETLKAGIPSETDSYDYAINDGGEGSTQAGIDAAAKTAELRSYSGLVFIDTETGQSQAVACQTSEASKTPVTPGAQTDDAQACGDEENVMQ